ncbi:hypothetical protein ACVIWU_002925 [Bradyrhizobium sp. USDA 4509]
MAGLDPAIQLASQDSPWSMDARVKPGHDDFLALLWQIVDFAAFYRIPESIFQ